MVYLVVILFILVLIHPSMQSKSSYISRTHLFISIGMTWEGGCLACLFENSSLARTCYLDGLIQPDMYYDYAI